MLFDVHKIKFEFAKNYYYDDSNKTIYGKEKYSKNYFHEVRHFLDYQNKTYRKIAFHISMMRQVGLQLLFPITLMTVVLPFPHKYEMIRNLGEMFIGWFMIPSIWVTVEELRANIFGHFEYKRFWGKK